MTDINFEPDDFDFDVDSNMDLGANSDFPVDAPVIDGNAIDLSQAPDPLSTADVIPVQFGQEYEFPDGTTIVDPHTDAPGYVYKTTEDWINGTNKYV